MSISEVSIRRPVFAWMLMFALIVFGAISFQRMGISQMPDVNFPVVNISLELDNAAPEIMEMDVVDVIEDAVMGIEGLTSVSSSVSEGTANITCEFALNHNVDVALQEVQNRITQTANKLPTALYPPVITKTNPEDQPILWAMVTADKDIPLYKQMIYARNTLKDQLSTISGVGNITLGGYVDPNLRVWIDENKLYGFDLASADIWSAVQAEQIEQPAGRIEAPLNEMNVRVLGEASSTTDFGKIRINTRGGTANYNPIPMNRVASIQEGVADVRAISRFNGLTAVGLGIVKQHGSNAVEVARLVREKIKQIQPTLLPGYHLEAQLDTTKFISESVHELNMSLIYAALLTSIVCYLFLGSWSSTFNVLLAIPTSIVGAFTALYFFGFTLNTFTLLGLSLAIGIVVDDAIMMLENIVRHYEMGKNRRQAAIEGSNEITFAALATTIAIAAIFIPVIFMQGVIGRFFYQYGITVTVAVFLSLLEALTLTPMRCARFMTSAHDNPGAVMRVMDAFLNKLSAVYTGMLRWCLNHRWSVVFVSVMVFVTSIFFLTTLREELVPAQDQSEFVLTLKTPVGTSIKATDEVFRRAEAYLLQQPEVKDYYTTVGNYENNNVVNAGVIYVILKDAKERKASQREMMDRARADLRKLLPGTTVFGQDLSLTGFSASRGYPIEFTLEGPDWDKLMGYSDAIIAKLNQTGLLEDINADYQSGMPEVYVVPDRDRAADRGVSVSTIDQEVGILIGGQRYTANTQYPLAGHRYDIRIKSQEDQHSQPEDVGKVRLRNNRGTGDLIPVSEVASIKQVTGPQLISRHNRARAIPIYANVANSKSQQTALEAVEKIAKETLPPGYRATMTGSASAFRDAFESLLFALILGVAVAYMVLASQFNSFIHPVTVLMALPFSVSGALAALYMANQSLSLFSMIGLILLMGIVKKNSILLVDFTNQRREQGSPPDQALLEACPVRLRPILMTSIATIAGAIPEALNFGAGAETRVPMAISIIGGVSLSTFLTLFVVPCVYSLFTKLERPEKRDEKRDEKGDEEPSVPHNSQGTAPA
ncbi:MAG: efflux RND transporter permease subunit [Oligoflexia bacterium]|nr:efflux RND transporter permease subunit [Oligoflexia bacterium]